MKPIELEIFFHNADTKSLDDMGMEFDWSELEIRKHLFLDISSIGPTHLIVGKGFRYCKVFSGTEVFVCNKSYEELKRVLLEYKCS